MICVGGELFTMHSIYSLQIFYVSLKGKNVDIWKYNSSYFQLEDFNTLII